MWFTGSPWAEDTDKPREGWAHISEEIVWVNPCSSIHGNGWLRICKRKCCSMKLGQCTDCRDNQIWSVVFFSFPHFSRIKHKCGRVTYVPISTILHFFISSPWCHWVCYISLLIISTVNVLSCSLLHSHPSSVKPFLNVKIWKLKSHLSFFFLFFFSFPWGCFQSPKTWYFKGLWRITLRI